MCKFAGLNSKRRSIFYSKPHNKRIFSSGFVRSKYSHSICYCFKHVYFRDSCKGDIIVHCLKPSRLQFKSSTNYSDECQPNYTNRLSTQCLWYRYSHLRRPFVYAKSKSIVSFISSYLQQSSACIISCQQNDTEYRIYVSRHSGPQIYCGSLPIQLPPVCTIFKSSMLFRGNGIIFMKVYGWVLNPLAGTSNGHFLRKLLDCLIF